jgi:hypothetical protein
MALTKSLLEVSGGFGGVDAFAGRNTMRGSGRHGANPRERQFSRKAG